MWPDVLAGVTLAALGIPEVLGYARIAGMPLATGLYTMVLPMAVFAVLGSSRHLVVAADSATAAILAAALVGLAVPGSARYVRLAGLAALLTAVLLLLARLARLSFLANFLSRTVLVGFLAGVGVQVAIGQLPDMLGLTVPGNKTVPVLVHALGRVASAHGADAAVSAAVIVTVLGTRALTRRFPGALIAVVLAIAASRLFDLSSHGVAVVGTVPSGLPSLALPALDWADATRLLGTAAALFVVILAQSTATARAYAAKYDEPLSVPDDLSALGAANLAAAFSGTFVVNGSPTKAQMVDSAGGRSQLAQLAAAAVVLVTAVLLTGPLAYLPRAALAAVVFLIAVELINLKELRRILRAAAGRVRGRGAGRGRGDRVRRRVRHPDRGRRLGRRPPAAQLQPAQPRPGEVAGRVLAAGRRHARRADGGGAGHLPVRHQPLLRQRGQVARRLAGHR